MVDVTIPDLANKAVPELTDLLEISEDPGSFHITISSLSNLYQLTSEKGAISGYAGLDASQELLLANFPTGTALQVLRRNAGNTALEFSTPAASGVTSINGDTTAAQIIAAGTGLDILDVGATHTLSIDVTVATSLNNLSFFAATTSAQLAGVISDETGTGFLVFATSPTIVTPTIASFVNATHDHSNAAGGGQLLSTTALSDSASIARSTDNLSFFAATTSAQLAGVISDETGTGLLVFGTSPTIVTPTIASFTNATHDHTNAAGGGQLLSTAALSDTADIVYLNTPNIYTAGTRQDFLGLLAGTAGLNVGGIAGNPTTQVNGDLWLNTSSNILFARINGVDVNLSAAGEVFVWSADHDADGFDLLNVGGITISNPADTFQYIITPDTIVADRILNLPLLTGTDTFVTEAFAQTLTNKIITAAGNTLTIASTDLTDTAVIARSTDNLSFFAATTSAQLAGVISDETGSGLLVFGTSPTIVTPTIASFTNATHDHTNAAGGGQLLSTTALSDTADIAYLNTANTYIAGTRQDFLGLLAGTAGLNVGIIAGNPTTQVDGDLWYSSSVPTLFARINGVNVDLGAAGEVFTWTADHSMATFKLTATAANDVILNAPTGQAVSLEVAATEEYSFSATTFDVNQNTITNSGDITIGNTGTFGVLNIGRTDEVISNIASKIITLAGVIAYSTIQTTMTNVAVGDQTATVDFIVRANNIETSMMSFVGDSVSNVNSHIDLHNRRLVDILQIEDVNFNELIQFPTAIASAVNQLQISNAVTLSGPIIESVGDDTNIDLNIATKGTGSIILDATTDLNTNPITGITNATLTGFIDLTRIATPVDPAVNVGRFYTKQIDTNNDGLFTVIKKNASFQEVQVA